VLSVTSLQPCPNPYIIALSCKVAVGPVLHCARMYSVYCIALSPLNTPCENGGLEHVL
jgi:hypothetical protein